MALALALVLHAHQPAGNFDAVIEANYQSAYRPFLEAAAARPELRLNLHYSGYLLDWLGAHHPEHIERLRQLAAAGRIELLGGGYYEPILAAIPGEDQQWQLTRLAAALERHIGQRPRGAWLAERVWEPELPAVLARAGVGYTLLDDAHFESAGIASGELNGYWHTESQGETVGVIPSNFFLRQALPFRPVREGVAFLLERGRQHPDALLTMGDDLEKFGAWPHTARHVYEDGWLAEFFDALEQHAADIQTTRLSDYLAHHPPQGLIYLPTGSYPEMMRWAGNPTWRGFLTKYQEANLLHKTQWELTRRLRAATAADAVAAADLEAAHEHLLAAECNDVYWHGWFGGLYSPHLRNLAFTHLLEADARLPVPTPRRFDMHGDGRETIELRTPQLRALITPSDGGTIEELDLLPARANLINSLRRRPEAYHGELRSAAYNPAHLPDDATAGDRQAAAARLQELEALLRYDVYPRAAGRLYLCAADADFASYQQLLLQEDTAVAGGAYAVAALHPGRVSLHHGPVIKDIALQGSRLEIEVSLQENTGAAVLELVFNLLAPDATDRYFEHAGQRHGLRWAGALTATPLRLHDGWRQATIELTAAEARAWWIEPLYTVSQSEAGFEAIYQGSAIAAVWPAGVTRLRLEMNFFL